MKRILMVLYGIAFLAAGCAGQAASGSKRVAVSVTENGFEPAEINAAAGRPVTLVVTRKTDVTCTKEIVLESEGIRRELPLNEAVEVTFTPKKAGEIRFACGMDMIAGTLKVH